MNESRTIVIPAALPEEFVNIMEWFYSAGLKDATNPEGSFHKALGEWIDGRPTYE